MGDHANFSCSDPDLSHEFVTKKVWRIKVGDPRHQPSITAIAVILALCVVIGVPWNAIVLVSS